MRQDITIFDAFMAKFMTFLSLASATAVEAVSFSQCERLVKI